MDFPLAAVARRTRSAGGGNGERGGAVAQPARIFAFIDVDDHQRRAGDAVAPIGLGAVERAVGGRQ